MWKNIYLAIYYMAGRAELDSLIWLARAIISKIADTANVMTFDPENCTH